MGTKNFSSANDLITFSRASGGTALRKIAYGSELVTNGTFDTDTTGWTAEVGVDATVTSGEVQLLNTAAGTGRNFYQTVVTEVGKVYSVSYYCEKTPGGTTIVFAGDSAGSSTGGDQQTVLEDGDSSFVFVAGQASTYITCRIGGTDGQGAIFDNISVKEVLFDQGTLTLFNHPADVPRIEYDADGNVLGLLVEESRTNLLTYSEDFSNAAWVKSSTTVSSTSLIAPDGSATAYKIIPDAASSGYVYNPGSTFTVGATITISAWFNTASDLEICTFYSGGLGADRMGVRVIIATATIHSNYTAGSGVVLSSSITSPDNNGWYRVSVTGTVGALTNANGTVRRDAGEAADGSKGFIVWGAQLEAGAFPTSYIPTAGATATRSADVASIPVADFGYNQSAVTVVVEADSSGGLDPRTFESSDGTTNNRARLDINDNLYFRAVVSSGGSIVVNTEVGFTGFTSLFKAALAYVENDFVGVLNGSVELQDTAGATPSITVIYLGSNHDGTANYLNGHIKSIRYFPRRLTNAQLQELTT
jgi:hypothetical protein